MVAVTIWEPGFIEDETTEEEDENELESYNYLSGPCEDGIYQLSGLYWSNICDRGIIFFIMVKPGNEGMAESLRQSIFLYDPDEE